MNNKSFPEETVQRFLVYSGFISFVLFWPSTNILLKNDSFRIIGNWSWAASMLLVIFFFIIPTAILFSVEHLLSLKNNTYASYFRWTVFLAGAGVIWTQLVSYCINPTAKAAEFFPESIFHFTIWAGGFIFIILVFRLRRVLPTFFMYMSLLSFVSVAVLIFEMFPKDEFAFIGNKDSAGLKAFVTGGIKKPVYILLLDGVSLTTLLDGVQINKELFPTFFRASEEWIWYRNATTNATSTIPARHMIFNGQYYGHKANSFFDTTPGLLQILKDFMSIHLHYVSIKPVLIKRQDPSINISNALYGRNLRNAITLNKAICAAYVEISVPSPLRGYLRLQPWKFDWRGEIPQEFYPDKVDQYYGGLFKEQFFEFIEDAADASKANGGFYLFWCYLTHYPYVFDEDGNIIETDYHSYSAGMSDDAMQKTYENNIQVLKFTDRLVETFIECLKANGLYDDSIIIITSDHGTSKSGSNYNVDADVARIPFFVKAPGLPAGPSDRDAQIIDIAPTVLDILGFPVPKAYDGQSLLRPPLPRKKVIYALGRKGFWVLGDDGAWEYNTKTELRR